MAKISVYEECSPEPPPLVIDKDLRRASRHPRACAQRLIPTDKGQENET